MRLFYRNSEMANSTRTASSAEGLVKGLGVNPVRTFSASALGKRYLLWTYIWNQASRKQRMGESSQLTKWFFSAACLYRFFTLNNAWVCRLNNENVDLFEWEMVLIIKSYLYNRVRKERMNAPEIKWWCDSIEMLLFCPVALSTFERKWRQSINPVRQFRPFLFRKSLHSLRTNQMRGPASTVV